MAFEYQIIDIQPLLDHSNTELVGYSDPHCFSKKYYSANEKDLQLKEMSPSMPKVDQCCSIAQQLLIKEKRSQNLGTLHPESIYMITYFLKFEAAF